MNRVQDADDVLAVVIEELDVRETAAAMRCSEGTVKSQTSRALAALRSMFEEGSRAELLVGGERNLQS